MGCPSDPVPCSVRLPPLHKVSRSPSPAPHHIKSHRPSSRELKTFDDISSVLTLSSPSRLDLPEVYNVAKESLNSFFPHDPTPYYEFGQLEEALVLAIEHNVKPVRDKSAVSDITSLFYCGLDLTSGVLFCACSDCRALKFRNFCGFHGLHITPPFAVI